VFLFRAPILLPILLYQSFSLALSQIWANKMRAMLTTVGIVIGVASVTAVIAALSGLKANVLSEFESFGTNKIYIAPNRPQSGPLKDAPRHLLWFKPDLFDEMMDHCPSLKQFTRVTTVSLNAIYGRQLVESVSVSGIEPAWHEIENRPIILGRPFSLLDNSLGRPVCLINEKLRDTLGLPLDCTGHQIILGDRRYLIVGVVEEKQQSNFNDNVSGSEVYLPFNTVYNPLRGRAMPPFVMVIAACRSTELSEEAKAEITFYLRKKRKISPGDPDTFRVEAIDQFVQQFNQIAGMITIVATGIVGVSLLVGGVGIMNIMLVSVSERTREIGLRKAVGAPPSAVLLQFLVEAVMLCLFGGLVGLLLGQGLTTLLTRIPNAQLEQAYIPGWAIGLAFGFAASVGVIFGMFPAIKAARLDPIEALRHE
jgi:putative ABC transport system permease protein